MSIEKQYALLLKGGRVIDPASGIDAPLDVAVTGGKIAAIGRDIPAENAAKTLRVDGLMVLPGLVDMHCHVLPQLPYHKNMIPALYPDAHCPASGVTTAVDAGTIGWADFARLHGEIITRSKTRVLAFVNIAKHGMLDLRGEDEPGNFSPEAIAALAKEYDCVVGSKTAHYWVDKPFDEGHGPWASVDAALRAARLAGLRCMVDMRITPPDRVYPALLQRLQKGDIHTHVYAPHITTLAEDGAIQPYMYEARRRGVRFDTGHGAASFSLHNAAPAIRQGFYPDSISTDLYLDNVNGPVHSLLHVMSKFLALGMPMMEVFACVTNRPAEILGLPALGRLGPDGPADIAVLRRRTGRFAFADSSGESAQGKTMLECVLTLRAGEILYNPRALQTSKTYNT